MNRQNQKIREITFSGQDAMLLIPPGMLKEAVALCRKAPEALLILDEFFPTGLREYLMQVLDANRHLPIFPAAFSPPDTLPAILPAIRQFPDQSAQTTSSRLSCSS